MGTGHSTVEVLKKIERSIQSRFSETRRVLSFEEYLQLLANKPENQSRGSAAYLVSMMDHFGQDPETGRFRVFDLTSADRPAPVVGHERVQHQLYRAIRSFSRQGMNTKLLLLHGPNGSAKSSIVHALMSGLELYSKTDDGAMYSFSWIFPMDKVTKGGMGITGSRGSTDKVISYAHLSEEEIACKIPNDLKDHPLLLIPVSERLPLLESLLGADRARAVWNKMPRILTHGDLSHRAKQIFDALLTSHKGDLHRVLMHVQVERVYLSRRYRSGLVSIEPQMHVDAQYQQITLNRSLQQLPPILQSLNLFTLSGDLIDGNRGVVEYNDLLKRPMDAFKYLLMACETGSVTIGATIAFLDTVLLGTTNEVQLDAFKEFPDFQSFKGRIELIRVPYLLSYTNERKIYAPDLERIGIEKHIAPHTDWVLALWSVLTRLKKPNAVNYPAALGNIATKLTPIEKARYYDHKEAPSQFSLEEKKILRSEFEEIAYEYESVPYYEGRMGASAREVKSIITDAAQDPTHPCMTPLAVFRSLENFVKRVTEHEFLRQEVKDGYHDSHEFIQIAKNEYLNKVDHEVRDSIGLYDLSQWEVFLKKYVQHVSLVLKKEKLKNPVTGQIEDPDYALIEEFEKIADAPADNDSKTAFRQNIISQVGAWSLDHPKQPVVYADVFPEFWRKLEKHYYENQKNLLLKMRNALLDYDAQCTPQNDEASALAVETVENMKKKHGYCDQCAREVIIYLMRSRY